MHELEYLVQQYAWGKQGDQSVVAQLKDNVDPAFVVNQVKEYAELWMGTHPNGPSLILHEGKKEPLLDYIQRHPETTGGLKDLPFLFKVLSVGKALSIQAHPDLALANKLHKNFPDMYKDPNHKPEIAIAITEFEALCQFRDMDEIAANLQQVPELSALVDRQVVDKLIANKDKKSLQQFFKAFIDTDSKTITAQLTKLRQRLEAQRASGSKPLSSIEELVLRLDDQFKNDIGCFCPFLLNYITLQPGESVFLSANEPHAYLSGDCVECMACSDNVVRAGLTPKFIDKDTLVNMLTYEVGKPSILTGTEVQENVRIYSPPIPEFEVEAITIPANQQMTLPTRAGPAILLVMEGEGIVTSRITPVSSSSLAMHQLLLKKGRVIFIEANEAVQVINHSEEVPLRMFRASPNEQPL